MREMTDFECKWFPLYLIGTMRALWMQSAACSVNDRASAGFCFNRYSPVVQMCLVAAICITLASTCNAAWVYGTSVKTSPYVGLSGNLSDVAHLMKDQVGAWSARSWSMTDVLWRACYDAQTGSPAPNIGLRALVKRLPGGLSTCRAWARVCCCCSICREVLALA